MIYSESPFELILELFVFRILLPNIIEANDYTFRQLIKSMIKLVSVFEVLFPLITDDRFVLSKTVVSNLLLHSQH